MTNVLTHTVGAHLGYRMLPSSGCVLSFFFFRRGNPWFTSQAARNLSAYNTTFFIF